MAKTLALIDALPAEAIGPLKSALDRQQAICENVLLHQVVSERVLQGFATASKLHQEVLARRL